MPKLILVLAALALAGCGTGAPPKAAKPNERHWEAVNTTWPTEIKGAQR